MMVRSPEYPHLLLKEVKEITMEGVKDVDVVMVAMVKVVEANLVVAMVEGVVGEDIHANSTHMPCLDPMDSSLLKHAAIFLKNGND